MSLSQPSSPDPTATAEVQQAFNREAAQQQAEMNMVDQSTPYGSLNYSQTGTNADGTPQYTATTSLSAPEQGLFNSTVGTQQAVANDAGTLANNIAPSLTAAPDLSNSALTKQLMGWQQDYMQPYFNMATSNLQSQLANQGITQGSQAYNNAMLQLQQSQAGSMENAMASDEGQAYNQALQTYQAPIQTLSALLGEGQPANVSSSLVSTPQETIQPGNYESVAEQNYQNQNQQYGNTMSGLFSIPSAILGGWARSGFATSSDRRKKRDIVRVGWLNDGTPIYRFRYLDNDTMHIGVMAQDIVEDRPEAISFDPEGFMMVDYERATENAARLAHG